jgi:S-DNA-T family DNA segregation ATPase FtsK/SpoIIIE
MTRSLRPFLELRADMVESVLAAHKSPGHIYGGTVGPTLVRFFVQPAPHIRFDAIRHLADDLALALRVSQVRVSRGEEGVILEFANPNPQPVTFAALLAELNDTPAATALLGLSEQGAPLLAHIPGPAVAHILISGTTGCGKSVLLRTMVGSLILKNVPEAVRVAIIDPKGRTFPTDFDAAHLIRPVITDGPVAVELLRSLVALMEARDKRKENLPRIIVAIDELADLIMYSDGISSQVERLIQRGREAGIHIIAATQRPDAAILSGIIRANFPLRLVGKTVTADDAKIAAGRPGTGAERLNGKGDFLAVNGSDIVHFQAAYCQPSEIHTPKSARPGFVLPPPAPEPVKETPSDISLLAGRLRGWWSDNHRRWELGEWGIQNEVITKLFPNDPKAKNAGVWRDTMLAVIKELENSTTTTRNAPIVTLGRAMVTASD